MNASFALLGLVLLAAPCAAEVRYSVTDLGILGNPDLPSFRRFGLNDSGQSAGYGIPNGYTAQHAMLFEADGMSHDLGTLGGNSSIAYDVNDSGQVTGHANMTGDTAAHAFVYDGTMHDLGTLGGVSSWGRSINENGYVTGASYLEQFNNYHALFYDGAMHDLGTFGGPNSEGYDINSSGHVTGFAEYFEASDSHAFFYDGQLHDIGTLNGYQWSLGQGINDHDHIVGYAYDFNVMRAFFYDGTMHDLGGGASAAMSINNRGQIVGTAQFGEEGQASEAALWQNGQLLALTSLIDPELGWTLFNGWHINEVGQITCYAYSAALGEDHAVLLTPVPEPSGLILAFAACSLIVVWLLSRRAVRLGTRCG